MVEIDSESDIVFIAPYRHMAGLARQVINSLNLSIPVTVAYDYEAVQVLRLYPNVKVVISRGGTIKFLRGVPGLTLVDLQASFYDVFAAVKTLIDKGCRNIAVVSQENIIGMASGDFTFSSQRVKLCPCPNAEDIIATVDRCINDGADGIAGCVVAVETANMRGVSSAFVDVDFFTVKKAVLEACEIEKSLRNQDLMLKRMERLLDNIEEGVVIFNHDNLPIFFNEYASSLMRPEEKENWYSHLKDHIEQASDYPKVFNINGHKVLMRSVPISEGELGDSVVIMQESSAIEETAKTMRVAAYEKGLFAKISFKDLYYESPSMVAAIDLARRFAASDSTVMIYGETGAGKEGFAQSIHNASPRAAKPFVSVNCATLPQSLVASELFGYVEGAFTGARRSGKKGLFEMAQGGTIFLDEITDIPLEVQSQFLRVIQEREVMRVGDDRIIPLDIRIICASNKDILPLCDQGKFRYDLYYRLNVLRLNIPSLRERGSDVVLLFRKFFAEYLHKHENEIRLDEEVVDVLTTYTWPGNVRELKNIAEALSFYGSEVKLTDLKKMLRYEPGENLNADKSGIFTKDLKLSDLEKAYLKYQLERHSMAEVAELSGMSRTTLWRKIRAYNL